MAQQRLGEGKPAGEFVGHIHSAAHRMLGILSGLLDTAALDAGKISLKQERVDLAGVARQVAETSRAAAAKKGQQIEFTGDAGLFVIGDEERLGEVIENLVSNAIKYSPFWLKIGVSARRDGPRAVVAVSDSGPGLTSLDKEKIFGRFQRLSARPTGGESSTGLGLAIAQQLAELMGGELLAASDGPGTGSSFTLSLPAAPAL
jgi:signal transduction histidine kinase